MKDLQKSCKIAVVQAAPVLFDKKACVEKAVALIKKCAENKAELIVFPELFIPGYPYGMTFGFTVGSRNEAGRKDWLRYYENSIVVPGPETEFLAKAAKDAGAWLSIGVSERDAVTATLYNTNLFFSPEGEIIVHRKLKPTGSERAALYQKGITLYISPNTNDNDEWQSTIKHIAIEWHCYFINCDMYFTCDTYPADLQAQDEIAKLPAKVCRGGSCIVDPYGHYLTEPVWDKEAVIYAELDMSKVAASRMEFDVCGHYARPDVLKLVIEDK